MRSLYFLLLIFSAFFYVMYKGDISLILLIFMIVLPIITLIVLCITSRFVKVSAHFEQLTAPRGKPSVLKITVKNRSFIPIMNCTAEVFYTPYVLFEAPKRQKFKLSSAVGAKSTETFAMNIASVHCGTVDVRVSKICIRDIMGLFSLPVKSGFSGKILSLPVIHTIQAELENNPVSSFESSTFSQSKSGDDPSEIFALREYREGDSNNRIHWKLSSRSDEFIVKELSLPIGCSTLIAADFYGCGDAFSADKILDAVFSVSGFLTEYGSAHSVAYAGADFTIKNYRISNADEFHAAQADICSKIKSIAYEQAFIQTAISDDLFSAEKNYSRVIAIADSIDAERIEKLEALYGGVRLTVICTGNPDASQYDENDIRFEIIYADAETLSNRELLII